MVEAGLKSHHQTEATTKASRRLIFTTIGIAVKRCSATALTIIETARVHTGIKEEMTKNRRRRRRPKKEINKFCGVCANLEAVCNQRTETIELIRVYKITLRCYFENVECACTVSIFQAQISPANISIGLYITVTSRCSFYFIFPMRCNHSWIVKQTEQPYNRICWHWHTTWKSSENHYYIITINIIVIIIRMLSLPLSLSSCSVCCKWNRNEPCRRWENWLGASNKSTPKKKMCNVGGGGTTALNCIENDCEVGWNMKNILGTFNGFISD